jgi:hypothetical protein
VSNAPHVFVVTCAVPPSSSERLYVEVAGRTVTAMSPDGFRHTFELPLEIAIERLEWQVYADVLELRVPYRNAVSGID